MLLNNTSGEPNSLWDLNADVEVVFLSHNEQPLQPMDQGTILSLKAYYFLKNFAQELQAISGDNGISCMEFYKKHSLKQANENSVS